MSLSKSRNLRVMLEWNGTRLPKLHLEERVRVAVKAAAGEIRVRPSKIDAIVNQAGQMVQMRIQISCNDKNAERFSKTLKGSFNQDSQELQNDPTDGATVPTRDSPDSGKEETQASAAKGPIIRIKCPNAECGIVAFLPMSAAGKRVGGGPRRINFHLATPPTASYKCLKECIL